MKSDRELVELANKGDPAAFALLFALSQFHGAWHRPLAIIIKAQAASISLLTLLATTSYPQIFGLASHLLPRILSVGLFLAYRLFFVLLATYPARGGVLSESNLVDPSESATVELAAGMWRPYRHWCVAPVC